MMHTNLVMHTNLEGFGDDGSVVLRLKPFESYHEIDRVWELIAIDNLNSVRLADFLLQTD